jgi:hypothetical protein
VRGHSAYDMSMSRCHSHWVDMRKGVPHTSEHDALRFWLAGHVRGHSTRDMSMPRRHSKCDIDLPRRHSNRLGMDDDVSHAMEPGATTVKLGGHGR